MGIQDPGLMGFQDVNFNGMPGMAQPVPANCMQPHASSSFLPNPNPMPSFLPPPQVPIYQPPVSSQPAPAGAPMTVANGNTNTIHYGNQFYSNNYQPLPTLTDSQLNSGPSHTTTEFSANRLALHSHGASFNRYTSATSLDNVSLDKELPDLGQLNSPLFSDASYSHDIAHGFCSPPNELPNSQSPSTSGTNSLTPSFDIDRKRSGCLDFLPNAKHLKLLSGIPTPRSQEIDNGLDIFSNQTTPRSAISTRASTGTPESFGAPCIVNTSMIPDHFSFKPNCDNLDLINAATSSSTSSEHNYWGNFDGFDPSMTPDDLLNEASIKPPFVANQRADEEQAKQRKLDALDILESLAQTKNDSLTSLNTGSLVQSKNESLSSINTDNQLGSKDDISLKSHSNSLVAGSPFQMARSSESFQVESVLNDNRYDPVNDDVFEFKSDDFPTVGDTDQGNQDVESQQSTQESTESTSDGSPIKVRNSILSSTDGQIIPRSRFYSSHYSDLPTPLSSNFSCSSPVDISQANSRISPVTVVIPPDVVSKEYMKYNPLLPPSPPPIDEDLDLHPDVPIIEVHT